MPATPDQIASDYPYLSEADQAKALDIHNAVESLMKIAANADTYPNADVRRMLGQQISALRANAVQMLGQK